MKSDFVISEGRRRRREKVMMLVAGVMIVLLSLTEYILISGAGPLSSGSNILIFAIINLNILLILLLLFLIVRNLVKLVFEDKRNVLGAKLRTKLVMAFVSLSLVPTLLLFFVAFQFLKTSLNFWFDIKVERSLDDALTVGQTYYQERLSQLQSLAQQVGGQISLKCMHGEEIDKACVDQWVSPGAFYPGPGMRFSPSLFNSIEVMTPARDLLFSKTWLPLVGPPPDMPASVLSQVVQGRDGVVQSDVVENGEFVRVLSPLRDAGGHIVAILAVGSLVPQNMTALLDEIRSGYEDYRQLRLFQNPIKATVLITLFLITLLILFVSIWFGFRLARGITEPVQMLADATHRIAQGDLDFHLEVHGRDELSSLVRAFNTMTQDLKEAKGRAEEASRQLRQSFAELERRQRYIAIILQNVAAGVISISRDGVVTTVNRSAENILGLSADHMIGQPYAQLLTQEQAEEFEGLRRELSVSTKGTLQRPIRLRVGEKTLSLLTSFTVLRDQDGRSLGVVVVFDDLTELERIQRIAAWREVARRIAHEVKNPLTPIQLSAQRLRKKCLGKLDEESQSVFERCTNTIISQVDELKRLVNEFSDFARMPSPRLKKVQLRDLAEEVLSIYREGHPHITFLLEAASPVPEILLDPDQIKRVLINLVDNAVGSMPEGGQVTVSVDYDTQRDEAVVAVADTGTGIAPGDRPRLFEPYFSRKKGGTGLGLAIVHSIVADHNGRIEVKDNTPRGTRFFVYLPSSDRVKTA